MRCDEGSNLSAGVQMAVAAISASPSFLRSSRDFSISSTRRRINPRRGALAAAGGPLSTPAPYPFLLRASSHGSTSSGCLGDVDAFMEEGEDVGGPPGGPLGYCCFCGRCGRRRLLAGLSSTSLAALLGGPSAAADDGGSPILPREERDVVARASRPGWYKELYAKVMEQGMKSYEAEVAGYKEELFAQLKGQNSKILELGVGTGPNIRYYAKAAGVDVFGVDPNEQMEKYARATAVAAGLPSTNFNFIHGVAEALPIRDNSMDAVVGTLVLCSVQDVDATLREVRRVLKPGGLYTFIEHVAAQDGSLLRLLQGALDPLQQLVADGCHLTRETGKDIAQAGFSDVHINMTSIPSMFIFSPHIYGIACK